MIKFKTIEVGKTMKERGMRHAYSRYEITIGTNVNKDAAGDKWDDFMAAYKQVVTKTFSRENIISAMKIRKTHRGKGHTLTAEYIKQIIADPDVEIAPKTGYFHAHCFLEIEHYTNIKLDFSIFKKPTKRFVQNWFNDETRGIYFNYKLVRAIDYRKNFAKYNKKTLPQNPVSETTGSSSDEVSPSAVAE